MSVSSNKWGITKILWEKRPRRFSVGSPFLAVGISQFDICYFPSVDVFSTFSRKQDRNLESGWKVPRENPGSDTLACGGLHFNKCHSQHSCRLIDCIITYTENFSSGNGEKYKTGSRKMELRDLKRSGWIRNALTTTRVVVRRDIQFPSRLELKIRFSARFDNEALRLPRIPGFLRSYTLPGKGEEETI